MPVMRQILPFVACGVLATGCSGAANTGGGAGLPAPVSLDRTRWGFDSSALAVPAPEAARDRIRLEFTADRLSANSGCNQGTTGFRLDADNTLVLAGPMATTRKACPPDVAAWERAFFDFLAARPRVRQEPGGRVLALESGADAGGVLRLRAEPMPSAAARQKFFYVAAERAFCVGVGPRECLQVRESPDQPWRLFYDEIIGFTHRPGTEYRLRVLEDDVPNPPADASSKRWFLDLVVEQKLVSNRP